MTRTCRTANQFKNWKIWLLVIAGFGLGAFGMMPKPEVDFRVRWTLPAFASESYQPEGRADSGPELVFVFIGASRCRWSNLAEARQLVRRAKLAVREAAHERGHGFAAVGIARDVVASEGTAHLREFGNFDEVTAGRGWMNIGVMRYVYDDLPGPAATPQIVVVKRNVRVENGQRAFVDEQVLTRLAGLVEIRKWVETGMVLGH